MVPSASRSIENTTSFEDDIERAILKWIEANPDAPQYHSYPVMFVFDGSFKGTFTGTINITTTALRFFIGYDNLCYSGTFSRTTNKITNLYKLTATSVPL